MSADTDALLEVIRRALQARDWRGVDAGLRVLAVHSPRDAQSILDVINIGSERYR